jgi:hypothetical protein
VTATTIYTSATLTVSAYSSIVISLTNGYGSGAPAAINVGSWVSVDVAQITGGSATYAPIHAEWFLDASMQNTLRIPVLSDKITVTVQLAKVASSVGGTLNIAVYGSSVVVPDIEYVSQSSLLVGTCAEGGVFGDTVSTGGNNVNYISSRYGEAVANVYGSGSSASAVVYAFTKGSSIGLAAMYTSTSPIVNGATALLRLPLLPVRVDHSSSSNAQVFSLVQ